MSKGSLLAPRYTRVSDHDSRMTIRLACAADLLDELQDSLRTRAPESPRWSPCVRNAYHNASIPYRGIVIGRIHLETGVGYDHAWAVDERTGMCLDSSLPDSTAHEGLVGITVSRISTRCTPRDLSALRPGFFLTMHCQLNDAALKTLLPDLLIDDLNHVNSCVDDPFHHPNYDSREHFDNSLIAESIALLDARLSGTSPTIATGAPDAIRYGLGCHAVGDFYAHSSYAPMALAYYRVPGHVPTIDVALQDQGFLAFLATWTNRNLWQNYPGYSSCEPYPLDPGFSSCLFTGGYGADQWTPRQGIPHHNVFAIDQPDNALVEMPPIQRRQHPFAYPGVWEKQYRLRLRLATDHVRAAMQRTVAGDPAPFLGQGNHLPDMLMPPPWTLATGAAASNQPILDRGIDGWPNPSDV